MYSRAALRWDISDRRCLPLLTLIVCLVVSTLSPALSISAEQPARSATALTEERLLQQFISSALNQQQSLTPPVESSPADSVTTSPARGAPEQPAPPANPLPTAYARATLNMVLALGATLAVLAAGGYVCRRYLLKSPWFGKRSSTLRVIARVNITPKAAVALVEVPGKLLVIGVTGNSVTGLSELPADPQPTAEGQPRPTAVSFAETLEQQTHHSNGHTPTEDPLLGLSENIQRKVRSLKQL